ncbi:hypothetical protein SAMN05192558_103254 [Actinokineospora alba]|uniref:2OG-Fe dioxygenase n=1 Tax=Actinokineospora alba TaxID=504798 RepID=A0A1H0JXD9_9PSEU|nr:2OG-Fe dioxygenase family protein [Actinokineospora alba]TDP68126.1 hypothetical protein C8E96_3688 [Actinokineospora alba]SDH92805.1 hypothetical protein SAMN05421871_102795 [Actinokineospora alba]SDO48304.1 hypothetical protein SAMN05192558_103254 [Actinokineospora alba]
MNSKKLESALDEIAHLKSQYVANRSAFVSGATMVDLLGALGATESDFARLSSISDRLPMDPTLPFRLTRSGRYCYSPAKSRVYRGEFQPFILTAAENFVRHDSGMVRRFAETDGDLQSNSVLHALLVFNHLIFGGVETAPRPNLDYDRDEWISTLFHVRTITTPDLVGEPALEGVHSDGADHTMTTFIGGDNLADDSAVTFLHDIREKNGTRADSVDPALTLGAHQHKEFLDTLLVVDNERKHSLSPVVARDPRREATRDMLIFFTRKPVTVDHVSHPFDSLAAHIELPMELDLPEARSER